MAHRIGFVLFATPREFGNASNASKQALITAFPIRSSQRLLALRAPARTELSLHGSCFLGIRSSGVNTFCPDGTLSHFLNEAVRPEATVCQWWRERTYFPLPLKVWLTTTAPL